jgi:hypothetical protein
MMEEAGFQILGEKFPKAFKEKIHVKNKQGFYESKFIDEGIHNRNCPWNSSLHENSVAKVFCHGIQFTDRAYINKVVVMVRDWREQEESWKQLKEISGDKPKYPLGYDFFWEYCTFLDDYGKRNFPALVVDYAELLKNPEALSSSLKTFLGVGRWDLSPKRVQPKMRIVKSSALSKNKSESPFEIFLDGFYKRLKVGNLDSEFRTSINGWKRVVYKNIEEINNGKHSGNDESQTAQHEHQ